jgi:AcrR family transcriptional regulator
MPLRRLTGIERRNKILEIAISVFADKGYFGTTMREVANACGVNESLIYQHFPTKEDLYLEAMEYRYEKLIGDHEYIYDTSENALDAIRDTLVERIEYYSGNPINSANLLHLFAVSTVNDRIQDLNTKVFENYRAYVVEQFKRGQEQGTIRKDIDPALAVFMLRSIVYYLHYYVLMDIEDQLPLGGGVEILDWFIDYLRPKP